MPISKGFYLDMKKHFSNLDVVQSRTLKTYFLLYTSPVLINVVLGNMRLKIFAYIAIEIILCMDNQVMIPKGNIL